LRRALAAAGFDPDDVLRLAAAVESASEHPLARAIVDGATAKGLVIVADAIKSTTEAALAALRAAHVRVIMLTGDDRRTAQAVGRMLGIDEIFADVLPQDKAAIVKHLQVEGPRTAPAAMAPRRYDCQVPGWG
jgi:P-type Cu+ transporter